MNKLGNCSTTIVNNLTCACPRRDLRRFSYFTTNSRYYNATYADEALRLMRKRRLNYSDNW